MKIFLFIAWLVFVSSSFLYGLHGLTNHYIYVGCDKARYHYVFESKHYGDFYDCYKNAYK